MLKPSQWPEKKKVPKRILVISLMQAVLGETGKCFFDGKFHQVSDMGSGSSINHGNFPVGKSETDSSIAKNSFTSVEDTSTRLQNDEEWTMIQRSPMKSLRFEQPTFQASLMPTVSTRQNSFLSEPQLSLVTAFSQKKGSYNFANLGENDLQPLAEDPRIRRSSSMRYGSARLHRSNSPDLSSISSSQSSARLDRSGRKTAMMFRTLRKTGSVNELFQKSKSRMRNSLRNWKFYARGLSVEEKDGESIDEPQETPSYLECNAATSSIPPNALESRHWLSQSCDAAAFQYNQICTPLFVDIPSPDHHTSKNWSDPTRGFCHEGDVRVRVASKDPQSQSESNEFSLSVERTQDGNLTLNHAGVASKTEEKESFDCGTNCHGQDNSPASPNAEPSTCNVPSESIYSHCDGSSTGALLTRSYSSIRWKQVLSSPRIPASDKADVHPHIDDDHPATNAPKMPINPSTSSPRSKFGTTWPQSPIVVSSTPPLTPVASFYERPSGTRGMSVSDVLAEGPVVDLFSRNLYDESSIDDHISLASSSPSELNSFGNGSTSFSESNILLESEKDFEEIAPFKTAIRKTGWLYLKHLLVSKHGKLEKPTRRKWQRFWVSLRGGQLLFYKISEKVTLEASDHPALIVSVHGSFVQAMHEHVTKRNVMCLSTVHGSVYLLQATSHIEVDCWIQALHIETATIFEKLEREILHNPSRESIRSSLQKHIEKIKNEIEENSKMLKLARLQNSLVPDAKGRKVIVDQISEWEENVELYHIHLFRLRCYLASLEGNEQPNPQTAISAASRPSKLVLSGLKLLNAATLHSLVISKQMNSASPMRRSSMSNHRGFEIQDDNIDAGSQTKSGYESISRPKKAFLFGSLRGGKKKLQTASVTGIIPSSASRSGSYSSSLKEERLKTLASYEKTDKSRSILPRPTRNYDDSAWNSTEYTIDSCCGNKALCEFNSTSGSLDPLSAVPSDAWCMPVEYESASVSVSLPTNDFVTVTTTESMTFQQLLNIVCQRVQLEPSEHFLEIENGARVKIADNGVVAEVKCGLKVKRKKQYSIDIDTSDHIGFSVKRPKLVCCPLVIESIMPGGSAEISGLFKGEEILVLNGNLTAYMDSTEVDTALRTDKLRLLIQTCISGTQSKYKIWWPDDAESELSADKTSRRKTKCSLREMAVFLKNTVVLPPPVSSELQEPLFIRSTYGASPMYASSGKQLNSVEDILRSLVIPPPELPHISLSIDGRAEYQEDQSRINSDECDTLIDMLQQKAEVVTSLCRHLQCCSKARAPSEAGNIEHSHPQREKTWKVIDELMDTETSYVKDLHCLLKRFLEPLHSEGLLASPEMESLLYSLQNIFASQKRFLKDLTESLYKERASFHITDLNKCLLSVASVFVQHASQFKIYAIFSSCHSAAQALIKQTRTESSKIRAFLDLRNPKLQHSLSLDSYLIKPIQRVLKYPLLLREMLTLSESMEAIDTKTKRQVKVALHAMHGVARQINDSQTVHDEFGSIGFQEVMRHATTNVLGSTDVEVLPLLIPANLLCYCLTEWQNAPDSVISRTKKIQPDMLVLVFRSAVVLLCRLAKHHDKKKTVTPQRENLFPCNRYVIADIVYSDIITGSQLHITGKCEEDENMLELVKKMESKSTSYNLLCNSAESKHRAVETVLYVIKECAISTVENYGVSDELQIPVPDARLSTSQALSREDEESNSMSANTTGRPTSHEAETRPSTKSTEQKYFYLLEEDNQSQAPSGVLPISMTIPLPTYEAAMSSNALETRGLSKKELHPKPIIISGSKSRNRRSGLYISMKPSSQNLTEDFFTLVKPDTCLSLQGHGGLVISDGSANRVGDTSNSSKIGDASNVTVDDSNFSDKVNLPSRTCAKLPVCDHRVAPISPIDRHSRPKSTTRYNMVYGVSPYESKL